MTRAPRSTAPHNARRHDRRVTGTARVEHLDREKLAAPADARLPRVVVGSSGDDPRDSGAVAFVVARVDATACEVEAWEYGVVQIGMGCVDAGVDNGDDHACLAVCQVPSGGQAELPEAPLVRPQGVVRRRVECLKDGISLWSRERSLNGVELLETASRRRGGTRTTAIPIFGIVRASSALRLRSSPTISGRLTSFLNLTSSKSGAKRKVGAVERIPPVVTTAAEDPVEDGVGAVACESPRGPVVGDSQPRSSSRAGTRPQSTTRTPWSSAERVAGVGAESAWGANIAPHAASVASARSAGPVRALARLRSRLR